MSSKIAFSEEQSMLLETAGEFFRDKSPIGTVRNLLLDEVGFDPSTWAEMGTLGWNAITIPEAQGGLDLGLGCAVCIAEPMGRYLSATPWLASQLCIQGLSAAPEDWQASTLPELAAGAAASVALFEADGSWNLEQPTCAADVQGSRVRLSGTKSFVLHGPQAHCLIVSVNVDGAPGVVRLVRDDIVEGTFLPEQLIDQTQRSFELNLDGLEIDADRLVTGEAARSVLRAIEAAAWLLLAAQASGGTAATLDLIVEYLNTREAFGRKIGGYQGLKHPSVDILIGLERARSLVYHAATLLDQNEAAEAALRMAKAQASDAYAFAGDRAVQFHGGFGFTWDCDAQLYLRRALWHEYAFGDARHHRQVLAGLCLD